MSTPQCATSRTHTVATGLMLLASGAAVWAGTHGWYSVEQSWAWWPLGFLFPAVDALTSPPPKRSLFAAAGWAALAAALILANLGHVELRGRDVLPVALVLFGLRLLYLARGWQGTAR